MSKLMENRTACGLAAFAAGCAMFWAAVPAHAAYPDKPVQVISPYAAGGANDFLTRLMAKELSASFGGNFVAENKAGANGIVGSSYVVKNPADGYTLLMGNSATHGTNPTLYPDTPYDAIRDFSAVAMVGAVPIVVAVNAGLGIHSVQQLIEYGRQHPGKLSFGSSGIGGTGHLAGEAFNAATKLDMVHAPYKGDAPAVTDAMGGQVSMAFVGVASAAKQAQSGKIRIIAVAHPNRLDSLPDVPTLAESGVQGADFSQWYALVTRAGTPKEVTQDLNRHVRKILDQPAVRQSMATLGAEPIHLTTDELDAFIRKEITRFGEIIKRLNIKVN